ncbi:unnamed protein product [Heligmosomoides polygyrus]|uniref:DUF3467 domain-containing protein n=1 Tax=Heligmosomoides polygyrus TaxID=6339 RepID=A0A183FRI9_HELPZ|nr:unnamed protein product [Heligmosomoides polygyrus]
MSKTSNNTSGLSLDACVNGDNIGPYFEVRNRIEVFSMNAVDDRVEADFVPYAYQVGSRLRRALNNVDRREHLEQKAKSKL